jgi:glycosyltransferase involved in cell wall biosynthesis
VEAGRLRILLVGDYPADARLGSPKVLYKLREEFARAGHHAEVLLADALGASPRSRHLRDLTAPWLAWRAVKRLLEAGRRYDVIDASGAEALVIARKRNQSPVLRDTAIIARSHGLEHLNYARMLDDARDGLVTRPWYRRVWYPSTRMLLVARAARRADRLIVANAVDAGFAAQCGWKQPQQIVVVPHGIADTFLAERVSSDHRTGLVFCGSWDSAKGIHYLARAFGQLCARRRDARLTVLGPGIEADSVLRDFPEHSRVCIRVVPRSDERRVIEELQQHAALVMCSTYEGFGMVVPEAMASGLAVIATSVGSAATLIRDGETGLSVPLRDVDRLSLAMERVLDDASLVAKLGGAARNAVRSLTWADSARRTVEVYRTALATRVRGSAVLAPSL